MIWNDSAIAKWAAAGGITPFDETLVNPASLDLRIGNQIREPHEMWRRFSDIDIQNHIDNGTIDDLPKWGEPKTFDTFWLFPKRFVLCHSLEFVQIPLDVACILVLKSSWGRKGLNHSHSGWGDPGFGLKADTVGSNDTQQCGAQWTFEIQNISPWAIKITAGDRLIQQVFMDMCDVPLVDYRSTGHYVYQAGATPART
jgi:dCTP deaminase